MSRGHRFTAAAEVLMLGVLLSLVVLGTSTLGPRNRSPLREAYRVERVVIRPGDTLWALAARYGPSKGDPRRFVHEVMELNGRMSAAISAGEVLLVPVLR